MKAKIQSFFSKEMQLIYLLSLAHLTHDIYSGFLSTILPILIKKLSISITAAAFFSVVLRIPTFFNPFIGKLSERIETKYFLITSIVVTASSMSLIGLAPNYITVLLLLFLAGVSSAFFHVPSPSIIKRLSKGKLGTKISLYQIGGELSRSISPLLAVGTISIFGGIEYLFVLIAIAVFVALLLLYKFKDISLRNNSYDKSETQKKSSKVSIRKTFADNSSLFIFIIGLLITKSFTASVASAFLPTYLTNRGESLEFAGGSLSILFGAAILGVFSTGIISDKIGRVKTLLLFSLFSPLSFFLFLQYHSLLFIILLGYFSFSGTPVIIAYIQESVKTGSSVANGIYMTMSFSLSALVILFFGAMSDKFGLEKSMLYSSFFALVGTLVLLISLREKIFNYIGLYFKR